MYIRGVAITAKFLAHDSECAFPFDSPPRGANELDACEECKEGVGRSR
jgi:hypothetical protein